MDDIGPLGATTLPAHDFEKNLAFSQALQAKMVRARIRKFYELCFLGLIDIEQPSYETYGGMLRERQGIDTQIALMDGDIRVQEKLRGPKYWENRQIDVYVELRNAYRGGEGWFEKYRDTIDFLAYFWMNASLSELHFVLYNRHFFPLVDQLIQQGDVFIPSAHLQQRHGVIGGRTSGCIVKQLDLIECEVARFKFSNDRYMQIVKL